LFDLQKSGRANDAFGGFSTLLRGPKMPRIFSSPGPVYEPEGAAKDYWRAGRAMYAAGFRAGDLAHNAFSYHMTPGAFIMESGLHAVGCTVFPAGVGQTEQQLQAIAGYPGVHAIARVPMGHGQVGEMLIKQYLDLGATTLLVPMVETAEQAQAVVRAARYPQADGQAAFAAWAVRAARALAATQTTRMKPMRKCACWCRRKPKPH